jgi:hypothetical protein
MVRHCRKVRLYEAVEFRSAAGHILMRQLTKRMERPSCLRQLPIIAPLVQPILKLDVVRIAEGHVQVAGGGEGFHAVRFDARRA